MIEFGQSHYCGLSLSYVLFPLTRLEHAFFNPCLTDAAPKETPGISIPRYRALSKPHLNAPLRHGHRASFQLASV